MADSRPGGLWGLGCFIRRDGHTPHLHWVSASPARASWRCRPPQVSQRPVAFQHRFPGRCWPGSPPQPDPQRPSPLRWTMAGRSERTHVPCSASLWCLERSCPCYFRLICAETNMVHFFLGVKVRPDELPALKELWGSSHLGLYVDWLHPLCPGVGGFGDPRHLAVCRPTMGKVHR